MRESLRANEERELFSLKWHRKIDDDVHVINTLGNCTFVVRNGDWECRVISMEFDDI